MQGFVGSIGNVTTALKMARRGPLRPPRGHACAPRQRFAAVNACGVSRRMGRHARCARVSGHGVGVRQLRVERNARQCELLLLAGLDRAALRAAAGETYMGEVWDVPAAEIGGAGAGQVTIEVSRPGGTSPQFRVLAEYPLGGELSIRRSRTVQMQSTTPLSQE